MKQLTGTNTFPSHSCSSHTGQLPVTVPDSAKTHEIQNFHTSTSTHATGLLFPSHQTHSPHFPAQIKPLGTASDSKGSPSLSVIAHIHITCALTDSSPPLSWQPRIHYQVILTLLTYKHKRLMRHTSVAKVFGQVFTVQLLRTNTL